MKKPENLQENDYKDLLSMAGSVFALIETLTANQREEEIPINTAGLFWVSMLVREHIERTLKP